jgi:hypothetical protein
MQEATEAKALAEVAARRADKMLAVARKAAGEVHAARALAEAERAEKAEYQSAKERVRHPSPCNLKGIPVHVKPHLVLGLYYVRNRYSGSDHRKYWECMRSADLAACISWAQEGCSLIMPR